VSVRNILLVEDDLAFAKFIIGSFRDVDPELDIFHVNSGYAAISIMSSGFRPDLIICEDRMPRMSGPELMAEVRADPSYQAVPFLTFTSSFADDLPAEPGRLPADLKMSRPTNYREALALVKRIRSAVPQEAHASGEQQAVTI
jgi:CheY-like chemotaxis protein